MKVLFFGTYDPTSWRNRVVMDALSRCGFEVVTCHRPIWGNTAERLQLAAFGGQSIKLALRLLYTYLRLLWDYRKVGRYDALVLGYPGHLDVFVARLLTWLYHKPLVLDAFLSLHETVVEDRAVISQGSTLAKLLWFLDKAAFSLPDLVLLDTQVHIEHFCRLFHLPADKFHRVWATVEPPQASILPTPERQNGFLVLYVGSFVPLHGVDTIIRAAKLLESHPDIRFELVGDGQTYHQARQLAQELIVKNVHFARHWLTPEEMTAKVTSAQVCLGAFGRGGKAQRVIPQKVFWALALGKPLITGDTQAAREALAHGETALLCPVGDPQALADGIVRLHNEAPLRRHLSMNVRRLYEARFTVAGVGRRLAVALRQIGTKGMRD